MNEIKSRMTPAISIPEQVVSGGQTGVDQGGWRAAKRFDLPTGGWMPKGFLTEPPTGHGTEPHPEFAELYGADELPTASFPTRTFANARDSAATSWFGATDTPGARDTLGAVRRSAARGS
jgi:hypothetical protein